MRSKRCALSACTARVLLLLLLLLLGSDPAGPAEQDPRGPRCPADQRDRCLDPEFPSSHTNTFKVDGRVVRIKYRGDEFELNCPDNVTLQHPALPRLPAPTAVRSVVLTRCAAPDPAVALEALNVLPGRVTMLQLQELPAATPLRRTHWAGLPKLQKLSVTASATPSPEPLPADTVAALPALTELHVQNVRFEGRQAEELPKLLQTLERLDTGASRVVVKSAPGLRKLTVHETRPVELHVRDAPMLETLTLVSANSTLQLGEVPSLRWLTLERGIRQRPDPWRSCGSLKILELLRTTASSPVELPPGWIAQCPLLRKLSLTDIPLGPLPSLLLQNATALRSLTLQRCALVTLPADLFEPTPVLLKLDLSGNELTSLWSLPQPGSALSPLTGLRWLCLQDNVRLAAVCSEGSSPMGGMPGLHTLQLGNTSVEAPCADWRGLLQLRTLDLRQTRMSVLQYADIMPTRNATDRTVIKVGGTQPLRINFTREQYLHARAAGASARRPDIELHAPVRCDCTARWAALAHRERVLVLRRPLDAASPRCHGRNATLRDVPLDALVCAAPDLCRASGMPPACTCTVSGTTATAHCERAGLRSVPGPLHPAQTWRLLLAHNDIGRVPPDALPPPAHLVRLDLAGNPLRCDCAALPLLYVLETLGQLGDVTCEGGALPPAPEALAAECARHPTLQAVLGAAALVLLAMLALRLQAAAQDTALRLRVKASLVRWGLRAGADAGVDADADKPYDAFVSHAHEDEEWVRELVARLEAGGRRVCVHYRDWAPGEWIPAQVAASVRASRRTLAVVSRHFLRSAWARLEIREAQAQARRDPASRLLVLLLEDPAQLALDAELRTHIANNTYVRCDDPCFWQKVERALPRPRARARARRRSPLSG